MKPDLFVSGLIALVILGCARSTETKSIASVAVATPASLSPRPDVSEAKFIATVSADLVHRFGSAASAERAGYRRYTAEDPDGIITYTNFRWWNETPRRPTQLWYDARGRLIGADYTARVTSRLQRPKLWGLQPGRWVHFIGHIHYVVREPDGSIKYGSMYNAQFAAAGGDPAHPAAAALVKANIAKKPGDVKLVFELPEIWITSFWIVANPNGAFADSNPNVRPTKGEHQTIHPM